MLSQWDARAWPHYCWSMRHVLLTRYITLLGNSEHLIHNQTRDTSSCSFKTLYMSYVCSSAFLYMLKLRRRCCLNSRPKLRMRYGGAEQPFISNLSVRSDDCLECFHGLLSFVCCFGVPPMKLWLVSSNAAWFHWYCSTDV